MKYGKIINVRCSYIDYAINKSSSINFEINKVYKAKIEPDNEDYTIFVYSVYSENYDYKGLRFNYGNGTHKDIFRLKFNKYFDGNILERLEKLKKLEKSLKK